MFTPYSNIYVTEEFSSANALDPSMLANAKVVSQLEVYEYAIDNLRNGLSMLVFGKKENKAWRMATGTNNPALLPFITEAQSHNVSIVLANTASLLDKLSRGETIPAAELTMFKSMFKQADTVKSKYAPVPDSITYYDLAAGGLRSFKYHNVQFTCRINNGEFYNQ